ncbi:hypothetical protein [Curtobacterium sp. MCSS17_016]|uniref:hypothetical protein n=1 Tax=Curtobacterium sp. MCSS17_016 TaxID=2175644 RepID=UPI000DA7B6F7|nr:hypothetical protein [Curtobacterium sp. MCSS17_016]WIE81004.1 hypothetical protein DEJ19_021040 [Curtobacterium sp. MCSS17_016]
MATRTQLRNRNTGKPGNGGHFDGFTPAADEDISLSSLMVIDDDIDVFYDSPIEHVPVADVVTFDMGEENLVADTQRLASQEVARMGMPYHLVDEVAGETLAAVYAAAASARKQGKEKHIHGGFIRHIARAQLAMKVDGHKRHESSKGLRIWKERCAELAATLGRALTRTEEDAIADQIRQNWDKPKHRPTVNFHRPVSETSLDGANEENPRQFAAEEQTDREGGARAHNLADLIEEKDLTKVQARRQLWNVFADEDGAPEARPGRLSPHSVRKAKTNIKDAVETARLWQAGALTDDDAASLFAPFGDLTRGEQDAVVKTILARPAYGHRMWIGAVDFAASTDGYLA